MSYGLLGGRCLTRNRYTRLIFSFGVFNWGENFWVLAPIKANARLTRYTYLHGISLKAKNSTNEKSKYLVTELNKFAWQSMFTFYFSSAVINKLLTVLSF